DGYEVHCETNAGAGLKTAQRVRPIVAVLDVMLPDFSGIELCRRLRADSSINELGVIMLTARSNEYDRVIGLEAGADDYVVKPFSVRELVLRVHALAPRCSELRQARQSQASGNRLQW